MLHLKIEEQTLTLTGDYDYRLYNDSELEVGFESDDGTGAKLTADEFRVEGLSLLSDEKIEKFETPERAVGILVHECGAGHAHVIVALGVKQEVEVEYPDGKVETLDLNNLPPRPAVIEVTFIGGGLGGLLGAMLMSDILFGDLVDDEETPAEGEPSAN